MDLFSKCVMDENGTQLIVLYEAGKYHKPSHILSTSEASYLMEQLEYSLKHRTSCTVGGGKKEAVMETDGW